MRDEYDFSKMKSRENPYVKKLKQQVTIRLCSETVEYFKALSNDVGLPYQYLIDLYLEDCVKSNRKIDISLEMINKKSKINV